MSIPKEPRQLMINLMYLVLTAMLALNVSAKIINAFFSIEKGINMSKKITDRSNELLGISLKKSAEQAAKYQPFVTASEKVSRMSKEFVAYVEEIRTSLATDGGNVPVDQAFYPADDHHHPGQPKNYKNKDITTRLLVVEGKGEELKTRIVELRAKMVEIVKEIQAMNIEGAKFDTKEVEELEKNLTLNIDDETWKHDEKSPSWSHFSFNQMPVASLWPMLTKFQNDAVSSEAAILNFLASKIGVTSIKVDAFIPIASPTKSYLLEGETFEAKLGVGASSKSFFENVSISVNGSSLPVVDGEATYKTTVSGVGEKSYTVRINVKNPMTGENLSAEKVYKYEVGKGSVAVELEKMNAIYIGVENPIAVSAAGVSSNKVSVSASGGGITLKPGDGNLKFVATATTPAPEAYINVSADGKQMLAKKVKVKRIPDPVAKLGGKLIGGKISPSEMKAQVGIGAVLENFDFDAKCDVVGFEMFRVPKRADPTPAANKGARFEGSARSLVDAATFGDLFLFENVKVKCPGDSAPREINTLSFQVK